MKHLRHLLTAAVVLSALALSSHAADFSSLGVNQGTNTFLTTNSISAFVGRPGASYTARFLYAVSDRATPGVEIWRGTNGTAIYATNASTSTSLGVAGPQGLTTNTVIGIYSPATDSWQRRVVQATNATSLTIEAAATVSAGDAIYSFGQAPVSRIAMTTGTGLSLANYWLNTQSGQPFLIHLPVGTNANGGLVVGGTYVSP